MISLINKLTYSSHPASKDNFLLKYFHAIDCIRQAIYIFSPHLLPFSVYDDIIKLTIEHLTSTLVHRDSLHDILRANRKINIHSCIQRTWLLLCGFHQFFGGSMRVEVKTIFLLPPPELFSFQFPQYRFMNVIQIQVFYVPKAKRRSFATWQFALQESTNSAFASMLSCIKTIKVI